MSSLTEEVKCNKKYNIIKCTGFRDVIMLKTFKDVIMFKAFANTSCSFKKMEPAHEVMALTT